MTKEDKTKSENTKKNKKGLSSFHLEADRCSVGMCMVISGVVGISQLSDEIVSLKSHGGRLDISGKRLKICVFENSTVEIKGRIEEAKFLYGKG